LIAALLLLVIVVFVVLTCIRERYREDVEITISELKKGAELIEGHIQQQYKLTIFDVELKALVQHRPVVNYFRRCRGLQEIQAEGVSQTSEPECKTESADSSKPSLAQPG